MSVVTTFALEIEGQQYLVTARHLGQKAGDDLHVEWRQGWVSAGSDLIGHCDGDVDISVYSTSRCLPRLMKPEWESPRVETDLHLAEDIRFYGFPYGLRTSPRAGTAPVPLVKAGIVSGFFGSHEFGPDSSFLIDGHNNPGFSGGPVVSVRQGEHRIAGVVSGYLPYDEQVVPSTSEGDGDQTGYVKQNTGIMLAWNIQHALDLIKQQAAG